MHEVRYPLMAIERFNMAVGMLIGPVEDNHIANLRYIGIRRHGLRSMPEEIRAVVGCISGSGPVAGSQPGSFKSQPAIHRAMVA